MFDKNKRVLLIVESPEKMKVITKIFKDAGYNKVVVMATIGHFTKVADGKGYYNTGIYPDDNFKIDYVVDPGKKDNVAKLKEQVKMADLVYLCTDPDREGAAIANTCIKFLNIPKNKYKRATYQAINQKAIFQGIENATDLDMDMVKAAQARLCLDKGLGYRVSGILRSAGKGKSAGRVQSAALRMIVEREEEILNFKLEKYIDLYLHFIKNNVEFKAKYQGTDDKPIKRLDTQEQIDIIYNDCKGNPFVVENIEKRDRKENPKVPFSTALFQQECSNKLGLTVKQAQDCAQKLFDSGKISYHRTDSECFEEEFEKELKDFVKDNFKKEYVSGTVTKGKNDPDSQEGHEALHVLDLNLTPDEYAAEAPSDLLAKVYRIIYNRTVACALNPAIISETKYNIYNKKHKFTLTSNELRFDGYRCVYSYKDDDTKDDDGIIRETFDKGEILKECSFESIPKETTPPARFKEASFVKEMKEAGIGRPSTYSTTIETIKSQDRGYVIVEDKCLKPTEKGIAVDHFLREKFGDLIDVPYTRDMEKDLDLIAKGKLNNIDFLSKFFNHLEETAKKAEGVDSTEEKICPECGKPMKIRRGKFGLFWGCSNYPKCKHIEQIKKSS